jgi:hypothetical protein
MTTLTEGRHAGEFIVSEANTGSTGESRSRDSITVFAGENLKAGAVLGKVTATGKYVEYDAGNLDGSEVAVAVLFDNADATAGDVSAVALVRDCEVSVNSIQWLAGSLQPAIDLGITELAAVGIIAR